MVQAEIEPTMVSDALKRSGSELRPGPTTSKAPSGRGSQQFGDSEDAESIARQSEEAKVLRERMERPARVGRYALTLLGAVTATAGLAFAFTSASEVGYALGVFGVLLVVLGVVQHMLYRRDEAHWPTQAFVWSDGLELVLHNGEVRGASWSDPDFALQLIARPARRSAGREYLLIWLMDSKVPPFEISSEGFDKLCRKAVDHGLGVIQTGRGPRSNPTQTVLVRATKASASAAPVKSVGPSGLG